MQDDQVETVEVVETVETTELPPQREPVIMPYGTAADWVQQDPILQEGQLGVEFDPLTSQARIKVGYRNKPWSELPYLNLGGAVRTLAVTETGAVLETIPSPTETGQVLTSMTLGGVVWQFPDPGIFKSPTIYQPKIFRSPLGDGAGPPNSLTEGILAVNLNGHVAGDRRAALYIGDGANLPLRLFSSEDLLINLHVKTLSVVGGANVADGLNLADTPLVVNSSELYVVTYSIYIYLFSGVPGRYGALNYTGEGGPGQSVSTNQFILISQNYPPATVDEIVNGSNPSRTINADQNFTNAIYTMIQSYGVSRFTTPAPNRPILTNANGKIDNSMLPATPQSLDYQGVFTPQEHKEYPDPTSFDQLWVVSGLSIGYEFKSGDCKNLFCHNGDQLIWNGSRWDLAELINLSGMLPADGSRPMIGDLDMGSHLVKEAAGIVVNGLAVQNALLTGGVTGEGLILDGGTF